jgi:predicted acyltransferase
MLVLRIILVFGALFLLGIALAFAFTRDRKYLRLGWRVFQGVVLLLVAFGLFYVFSRVLLL